MTESVKKTPQIKRLNLLVTKYCNLRCRMCDYTKFKQACDQELSLPLLKSIIKEFAAIGGVQLELSGGEPMVRKDIYEIIAYAHSFGLKILMISNGTLIGQAETEKLLKAGLTSVSFSLEGPEQLNDRLRGRGNFQKTINAIQSFLNHPAKQLDFELHVGITLSKYNYKLIVSFTKYLLEEIGVHKITINPFDPKYISQEVGVHKISINPFEKWMLKRKNPKTRTAEFEISQDLIPDLSRELERLMAYGKSVPERLPAPSYLRKLPDYFLGKKFIPPNGCNIPATFCGIDVNGSVYPCWKTPPAVGDLQTMSLTDILNSRNYQEFCERVQAGKCNGCLTSCYPEIY